MAAYDAVLFDFDGVLIDSEPVHWECWQQVLSPFGISLDWNTYRDHCIGITDRAMVTFLCSCANPPLDVDTLYNEYPRKKELFRSRMTHPGALAADTVSLILDLAPDYKLGVVTSSGRREVEGILAATGLLDKLNTVVYGDDVQRHKPAPDPYLMAVKRLGVERALVIEDSKAGIESARAAGLDVLELTRQCDLVPAVKARLDLSQRRAEPNESRR